MIKSHQNILAVNSGRLRIYGHMWSSQAFVLGIRNEGNVMVIGKKDQIMKERILIQQRMPQKHKEAPFEVTSKGMPGFHMLV